MKFFIGSDVFENRSQSPILIEFEVGFELDGFSAIEEPRSSTHCSSPTAPPTPGGSSTPKRASSPSSRSPTSIPRARSEAGPRKIRMFLDPKEQLKGLHRAIIANTETCWLRLEITKAALTYQEDKKSPPMPISMKVYAVKLGVDGVIGKDIYEQPMPGLKVASVEYREQNRRLTARRHGRAGRLSEQFPFDTFIDIQEDSGPSGVANDVSDADLASNGTPRHVPPARQAAPDGRRHAFMFKCRGETYLPTEGMVCVGAARGRSGPAHRWRRLTREDEEERDVHASNRSGVPRVRRDPIKPPSLLREPGSAPSFRPRRARTCPPPAVSHLMLNTVEAVNLHEFRMEKFSGLGVPHQTVQLRRFPIFLHSEGREHERTSPPRTVPRHPGVRRERGRRTPRVAPGARQHPLTASKDDRVFIVDPSRAPHLRQRHPRQDGCPSAPTTSSSRSTTSSRATARQRRRRLGHRAEGFADLVRVQNLLPATGRPQRRDDRRDHPPRAVSAHQPRPRGHPLDFEIIAKEASARSPGPPATAAWLRRRHRGRRPAAAARGREGPRPVPLDRPQGARAALPRAPVPRERPAPRSASPPSRRSTSAW
jgi:hypothetical protein